MALRVVYFGNSLSVFSNRHFRALTDTSCDLVAVVDVPPSWRASTNPAAGAVPSFVQVARQRGVRVLEPSSPNLPEFVDAMRGLAPDLLFAAGYSQVLREQILSVPRLLPVNFHASLLPAYRGKHPVFWALRNGERWAGLTVHIMDTGLDTGDILYQVRVRIREQDSVVTLYDRIMDQSVKLVGLLVKDAEEGMLRLRPQPEVGASYYSSVDEDDFRLDWAWDAEDLCRRIHITPGRCFCDTRGSRVFFMDAQVVGRPGGEVPGALMQLDESFCEVATGKDALRVRCVRLNCEEIISFRRLCQKLSLEVGDSMD
jgi:methionyl-tRNA formyltransferase